MTGDVTLRSPTLAARRADEARRALAVWQRRTIEAVVSLLAFAVWGILAYKGLFRLLARWEGLPVGGPVVLDVASLVIGVSGSIAGLSALWAVAMRALGRTPVSLVGAPDDSPGDRVGGTTDELRAPGANLHG